MSRLGGAFASSVTRRDLKDRSGVGVLLVGLDAVAVTGTTLISTMWSWRYQTRGGGFGVPPLGVKSRWQD